VVVTAFMDDNDFLAAGLRCCVSLSEDAVSDPPVLSCFFSVPVRPKSKADPGVFGVLFALPKLANAPEPSPNADEAPVLVGEATAEVVKFAENGLPLPLPPMLLNLLAEGVGRSEDGSAVEVLFIDKLSLLLLLVACAVSM
jgi:hypothetical protein